jgi:hypothetical protein
VKKTPRQKMVKKINSIFGLRRWSSDSSSVPRLSILKLLGGGVTQSEIAKKLGVSKQSVNYWTLNAVNDGLLHVEESNEIVKGRMTAEFTQGKPKTYLLTALGQKILTGSEHGYPEPVTLEDYALKFPLISDKESLNWEKVGNPKNWVKLGIRIGHVWVEKYVGLQPSVIIHSGQLVGFDSEELFVQAGQIIEIARIILQDKGVQLGIIGSRVRDPNLKFYTPEANELHDKFGNLSTGDGTIDASPPDKIPHEERNREQQRDYLAMASRIRRIEEQTRLREERDNRNEQRLERIEATQERISTAQENLAVAEEKIVELIEKMLGQQELIKKQSGAPKGLYE